MGERYIAKDLQELTTNRAYRQQTRTTNNPNVQISSLLGPDVALRNHYINSRRVCVCVYTCECVRCWRLRPRGSPQDSIPAVTTSRAANIAPRLQTLVRTDLEMKTWCLLRTGEGDWNGNRTTYPPPEKRNVHMERYFVVPSVSFLTASADFQTQLLELGENQWLFIFMKKRVCRKDFNNVKNKPLTVTPSIIIDPII